MHWSSAQNCPGLVLVDMSANLKSIHWACCREQCCWRLAAAISVNLAAKPPNRQHCSLDVWVRCQPGHMTFGSQFVAWKLGHMSLGHISSGSQFMQPMTWCHRPTWCNSKLSCKIHHCTPLCCTKSAAPHYHWTINFLKLKFNQNSKAKFLYGGRGRTEGN